MLSPIDFNQQHVTSQILKIKKENQQNMKKIIFSTLIKFWFSVY